MNETQTRTAGSICLWRPDWRGWLCATVLGLCVGMSASAQTVAPEPAGKSPAKRAPKATPVRTPEVAPSSAPNAESATDAALPTRQESLRELKKIRAKYFGTMRNQEIRQIGISKLRAYADPSLFADIIELFAKEKQDVRGAVLDLFLDHKSDEGDTALAWAAVFDKDSWFRAEATKRLVDRVEKARAARQASESQAAATAPVANPAAAPGAANKSADPLYDPDVSWRIKAVIRNGLKQADDKPAAAAAELAGALDLFELIPALISGQIQTPTGTGASLGDGGGGALAYIQVGTQQAFISDVTPVVGDQAVAFDPTLSVVTEGTVLAIYGAHVITYRVEVHRALTRLANSGWNGGNTEPLGWDNNAWRRWFEDEFVPYRRGLATP